MEVRPLGTMRNPLPDVSKPAFRSFRVQAIWLPIHRRRETHSGKSPSRGLLSPPSLGQGSCRPIARDGIRHHLPIQPNALGLACQGWSCPEIECRVVDLSSVQKLVALKSPQQVVLKRQCCQWRNPRPKAKMNQTVPTFPMGPLHNAAPRTQSQTACDRRMHNG